MNKKCFTREEKKEVLRWAEDPFLDQSGAV